MNNKLVSLTAAPRFSLGAALLVWGWQTGFLPYAVPMILLVEMSGWVSWRWPISNREFNNASDLSGVGFFITVVYIFMTTGTKGIFVILSVMPFVLLPLLMLQRYSERGRLPVNSLFVSLRRLDPDTSPEAAAEVDLSLPYLLVCIVSASAGNLRGPWFFVLTFALFVMVLWSFRPQRYRISSWAGLLCLGFIISYAGQQGIREVQRSLEGSLLSLFDQFMWRHRDPERASTAIGSIGRLKLSDSIVLRIDTPDSFSGPLLLREASYQYYGYGVWSNADSQYTVIDPSVNRNHWPLAEDSKDKSLTISVNMSQEVGVVPLPHGATAIRDVAATEINQSQYGTVKMEIREGWISYTADYQSRAGTEGLPTAADLQVTGNFQPDFARLAKQLDLYNKTDVEVLKSIEGFFANNFHYTLSQRNRYPRGKYLSNFLFTSREGHCEYFATATVLLLRTAGIPARYVAGYAVDEYSTIERQYIARSRDAHSWAIAFIDGHWRTVDTTPAIWSPLEDSAASTLQPLMDIYAWFSFRLSEFQTRDELEQQTSNNFLIYLLIPLLLALGWRLYFKQRVRRTKPASAPVQPQSYQGMDSHFYQLVNELHKAGYVRRNGETLANWFNRIKQSGRNLDLDDVLSLHYRYRFDPDRRSRDIKAGLNALVESVMQSRFNLKTSTRVPPPGHADR